MLNSFELLGFISANLSNQILSDSAEDNREIYDATLSGVAKLRRMRPQFLRSQPKPARHKLMIESLKRPAFEEVASQLLRGWLIKHQKNMLILFLDTLNIQHEDGVVEDLPNEISDEGLDKAINTLLEQNEQEIVVLYLHAFQSMNDSGWANLETALESDARLEFN
ncbi:MAG: hypothetical protein QF406_06810 [Verrucomicrobiota bacterium]|jgi:hypothetical protein|nr:hypothetical protein [Verrucomicrobiota bacterium]